MEDPWRFTTMEEPPNTSPNHQPASKGLTRSPAAVCRTGAPRYSSARLETLRCGIVQQEAALRRLEKQE
jgi:hypothetical protein